MSDLIERLRDHDHAMQRDGLLAILTTVREAADQLEAQQAEIARLREVVNALCEAECECDPTYSIQTCLRCQARKTLEQKP